MFVFVYIKTLKHSHKHTNKSHYKKLRRREKKPQIFFSFFFFYLAKRQAYTFCLSDSSTEISLRAIIDRGEKYKNK